VTLERRAVIKEGDDLLITRHDRGVQFAVYDLADHTTHRHETSAISESWRAASVLPDLAQTLAAGVRDLAFAGMGAAWLLHSHLELRPT